MCAGPSLLDKSFIQMNIAGVCLYQRTARCLDVGESRAVEDLAIVVFDGGFCAIENPVKSNDS